MSTHEVSTVPVNYDEQVTQLFAHVLGSLLRRCGRKYAVVVDGVGLVGVMREAYVAAQRLPRHLRVEFIAGRVFAGWRYFPEGSYARSDRECLVREALAVTALRSVDVV